MTVQKTSLKHQRALDYVTILSELTSHLKNDTNNGDY